MTTKVLVHFKDTVDTKNHLKDLGINYKEMRDELDVIVDDVPYTINDGIYEDPDVQFCDFYGFNYNLVNCIEAM